MLRVGICDDEAGARDGLRLMLERLDYFDRGDGQVIYEFSSGEGAVRWLKQHKGEVDLLFLDVEMGDMDGVEAARQIRSFDRHILLVFLTGYPDFVFQGYQVEALDYLLKPVGIPDLKRVIERANQKIRSNMGEGQYVILKNSDGTFRISKEDILYCGSQGRLAHVFFSDGRTLTFYQKLNDMEQLLGQGFVRIHQRYLVNSGRVTFIGRELVRLADGSVLPVSRSMRDEAAARLAKSLIGV